MKLKRISFCLFLLVFIFLGAFSINVNAYGWGFKKNSEHEVVEIGMYEEEIKGTNSYYVGEKNNVYLTFDAGYDKGTIDQIIKVLEKYEVNATFFLTGDFIERNEDLVKRMDNCKYITIGNHTYSHKNITKLSDEDLKKQIEKTEKCYYEVTNKQMPKLFRPPEGEFDKESLMKIKNLGYSTYFWSIAFYDWNPNKSRGVEYSIRSVCDNLHDGSIILLHSVNLDNVRALPQIIEKTQLKGYKFSTLESIKLDNK